MMKLLFGGKKKQKNGKDINQNSCTPAVGNITTAQADTEDDELMAVITAAINACHGKSKQPSNKKYYQELEINTPVWGKIGRHEQMINRF